MQILNKKMNLQERRDSILKSIKEKGEVTTRELCDLTHSSIMTINRDLRFLEKNNAIIKIHGGAIFPKSKLHELAYDRKLTAYLKEKEIIAKKTVNFINDGDSIVLDESTTSIILARFISKQNFSELTVITNSNYVIDELRSAGNISIISTGGEYIPKSGSLTGIYTEFVLSKLRAKKLFLSAAGISLEEGLTDENLSEISVKNKMCEISDKIFLLVDSSKFNTVATHKFNSISIADFIITDKRPEPDFLDAISKMGKKIEIV
jgi:DeoR family transcriptional regulator, fructose operon transcriptional repressor